MEYWQHLCHCWWLESTMNLWRIIQAIKKTATYFNGDKAIFLDFRRMISLLEWKLRTLAISIRRNWLNRRLLSTARYEWHMAIDRWSIRRIYLHLRTPNWVPACTKCTWDVRVCKAFLWLLSHKKYLVFHYLMCRMRIDVMSLIYQLLCILWLQGRGVMRPTLVTYGCVFTARDRE